MYGDMGRHCGAPILPRLQIEVKDPENAAIIHVGDIAYNLESDGGKVKNLLLHGCITVFCSCTLCRMVMHL